VCGFDNGYDPEVPGAYAVLPVNPEWDGRRVRRRSSSAESASSSASASAELFYRTLPVAVLIDAEEDDCYDCCDDEGCSHQSSCGDLEYEWELLRWTGAPGSGGRSAPVMLVVVSDAVLVVASASDSSTCCTLCCCGDDDDDESTWVARSACYCAPATLRQLVSNHVLRWKQGEIRAGRKFIILFAVRSAPPTARPLLRAAAGYAMMRIVRTDPTTSATDWRGEGKDSECDSGPRCRGATAQLPAPERGGAEADVPTFVSLTNSRYILSRTRFTPFLGMIPTSCLRQVFVVRPGR
jgi:hypothetical protein